MSRVGTDTKIYTEEKEKENYRIEYGKINSKLEEIEECYLCGNADRSLMGYYRKFDTIGIIGLNEWYVLDLRLKDYDEYGNENYDSGSVSMSGGMTQGVQFEVEAVTSRGRSRATISSEEAFDAKCIENNLCQMCLDKVMFTLERYCKEGKTIVDAYYLPDRTQ